MRAGFRGTNGGNDQTSGRDEGGTGKIGTHKHLGPPEGGREGVRVWDAPGWQITATRRGPNLLHLNARIQDLMAEVHINGRQSKATR